MHGQSSRSKQDTQRHWHIQGYTQCHTRVSMYDTQKQAYTHVIMYTHTRAQVILNPRIKTSGPCRCPPWRSSCRAYPKRTAYLLPPSPAPGLGRGAPCMPLSLLGSSNCSLGCSCESTSGAQLAQLLDQASGTSGTFCEWVFPLIYRTLSPWLLSLSFGISAGLHRQTH